MIKIYIVISDCGDGSHTTEWYKNTSRERLERLEVEDPNTYSSGDGIQIREILFYTKFDLNKFVKANDGNIYWSDEDLLEE